MLPGLQKRLVIFDCLTGEAFHSEGFPFLLGGAETDLVLAHSDPQICSFIKDDDGLLFQRLADIECMIDGAHAQHERIPPEKDHSLLIRERLFLFNYTSNAKSWIKNLKADQWILVKSDGAAHCEVSGISEIMLIARQILSANSDAILRHQACNTGFYLRTLEFLFPKAEETPASITKQTTPSPLNDCVCINADSGAFTCPVCWLRFDRGDAMHIAVHQALKGDPLLGEDAMLRFLATNFNNKGQALDAMGVPTSDLACPHCRGKLPPGFLDLRQHILSIVGAPQSGKSYYLSVLTQVAKKTLFSEFNASFHDGDPTGNRMLTAVTNNLFSASTPEQARIAKTGLEGDMYLDVQRMGRRVKMPRPFTFQLSPSLRPDQSVSLVFYDNAGEHFEPGIDGNMSPGAQHISAASGIIFLFDPTYNLSFRKRLSKGTDPQLTEFHG